MVDPDRARAILDPRRLHLLLDAEPMREIDVAAIDAAQQVANGVDPLGWRLARIPSQSQRAPDRIRVAEMDSQSSHQPLHICPSCECELVQPVAWSESNDGRWELLLSCPNCWWETEGVYDEDAVLEAIFRVSSGRQPGDQIAYSNGGYHLLGILIHRVTGEPWHEWMAVRMFKALGLKQTGPLERAETLPERAVGYVLSPKGGWKRGHRDLPAIVGAAGGLMSSVPFQSWSAPIDTAVTSPTIACD